MILRHISILYNELSNEDDQQKYAMLLELRSYYWIISAYCNNALHNCNCEMRSLLISTILQLEKIFLRFNLAVDVEQQRCDICKILPCEIFPLLDTGCTLYDPQKIESLCAELQYHVFLSWIYDEIIGKCRGCDNFVEYEACLQSACKFIEDKDINKLQKFVYFWKNARNNDEIFSCAEEVLPFAPVESSIINTKGHITVYLDFNIYNLYERKSCVKEFLDKLCTEEKIDIVCSGTHFEEIFRMNDTTCERKRLESISSLTNGKIVLIGHDGCLTICKEDIKARLNHTMQYRKINSLAEEQECIKAEAREHLSLHTNDPKRDAAVGSSSLEKIINNKKDGTQVHQFPDLPCQDDLDKILKYVGIGENSIRDYDNLLKNKNLQFNQIRSAIVSIARLLNVLGLHGDKIGKKNDPNVAYPIYHKGSYRTIRSGFYDNDHLSFATKCTYFVTQDRTLFLKATEIYNFLGIDTKPIMLDDFMKSQL